jgi:CheY-like chemotaxis protein
MRQVIYSSRRSPDFSLMDIIEMLEKAQASNAESGISGILLFGNDYFLQVIEGFDGPVSALRDKVLKDPRHQDIVVHVDHKISSLTFTMWKMSFIALDFSKVSRGGHALSKNFTPNQLKPEEASKLLLKMETLLSEVHTKNSKSGLLTLVLDDDNISGLLLEKFLKHLGHTVVVCKNLTEAWAQLADPQTFDLIFCDVHLLGESGLSFLKELRQKNIHVPVVMMSADSHDKIIGEALRLGADGYLIKPYDKERLSVAIRQAILSSQLVLDL